MHPPALLQEQKQQYLWLWISLSPASNDRKNLNLLGPPEKETAKIKNTWFQNLGKQRILLRSCFFFLSGTIDNRSRLFWIFRP